MIRLSVNINKIATLRNARGGEIPNVLEAARNCEKFGADGITVHPRPDERHIRYADVRALSPALKTEFNIEGYPSASFMDLILEVQPAQVTLVPDPPEALTSNAGWDTVEYQSFLSDIIKAIKEKNIRTSLFMECDKNGIEHAAKTGTDRIELYTESFASHYPHNPAEAVSDFRKAAKVAHSNKLGVNAGHDLNLQNLQYFADNVPHLEEVSIGHALIADALYYGLENTVQMYKRKLEIA